MTGSAGPRPPAPEISRPGRLPSALAALLVLALAGIAGAATLSSLYTAAAFDLARRAPADAASLAASDLATRLAPWRAEAWMRRADSLSAAGHREDALAAVDARLQTTPADAYAWLQRARIRASNSRFGTDVLADYRMALSRLPHSDTLNLLIAFDGLHWWRFGNEDLQALWLDSMRHSLRHDRRRFLRQVILRRRETVFCSFAAAGSRGLAGWCAGAAKARVACATPDQLKPRQAAWCRREGFSPEPSR